MRIMQSCRKVVACLAGGRERFLASGFESRRPGASCSHAIPSTIGSQLLFCVRDIATTVAPTANPSAACSVGLAHGTSRCATAVRES